MMLRLLCLGLCLALSSATEPHLYEDDASLMQDEARFLYFNSSSTATSLTLLGALILLGVIFYLVYVGGLLAPVGSQSAFNRYGQDYGQYQGHYQARSAQDGWDFNAFSILQWINMATEMYENFEYDNLECQKRMICDVMTERDVFGGASARMESGFEMAKYLEILNLPDELRELLDEYMDASEKAKAQKSCAEFFPCPYSIGQSVKKNLSGNSL